MARNGSGTYTVPNTFVSGQPITAASHNANWTDAAAELTNSLALDGQSAMTGQIKAASGSVGAPGWSFSADLDCGMYRIGANNIGIAAGGTKVFDIGAGAAGITGSLTVTNGFTVSSGAVTLPANTVAIASVANQTANRLIGTNGSGVLGPATISAGLAYASSALALDINALSEDTAPLPATDFVLTYDASAGAHKKAKIGAFTGAVAQRSRVVLNSAQNITATIPNDATIPQITEGTEVSTLSIAITPTVAASTIRLRAIISYSPAGTAAVFALFKSGTNDALVSAMTLHSASEESQVILEFEESAASTAARTYSVRAGTASGTLAINGGVTLGGTRFSSLVVEQVG